MSINAETPTYVLGESPTAEYRLELLNEITYPELKEALGVLPHSKVRVLIIGCGSGHLEETLSNLFSESHFVGIDINETRIKEAKTRTGSLECSNTYEYILADLTKISFKELGPFDILISRFVLSHLSDPKKLFHSYASLVRPGGYICIEEGASDGTEYYCNTKNDGYESFVKMVDVQIQAQKSCYDLGFQLLSQLKQGPCKVLYTQLSQAILKSPEHKSILRLGLEELKASVMEQLDKERVEMTISSLKKFEQNDQAFGLYVRFMTVVAQTPMK